MNERTDLPSGWANPPVYARYSVQLGKMLDEKRIIGTHLAPYLRNVDVQWDGVNTHDLPLMDFTEEDRERYNLRKGDLLVCEGGEVGRTAVWKGELAECFFQKAIHRLRPTSDRDDPRFFRYFMRMSVDRGDFALSTASTIQHLTAEKLRVVRYPAPPAGQQRAIADYLDRETARLDALVAAKERLLGFLAEKRRVLITRAVTRGLETNFPLRNSGNPWLGEIPAHWQSGCIRRFATMKTGHTPDRNQAEYWRDCDIPWFTLADVWQLRDDREIYLRETKERISQLGLANSAAELLPTGTVVFSRTASIGFSGIMPQPMATTQDFWNWIPGPKLSSEYLLYVFRAMRPEFERLAFGSTHRTIYQPEAAGLRLAIPPLTEQHEIVRHISTSTAHLDEIISATERTISLIQERRTALVVAAVTGQIDVAAAA